MVKVIISNGHFKFILGPAAAEAHKRGILVRFITAGYPTGRVKQWISTLGLARYGIVKRLLNREEAIPESLVHPLWVPEFITQFGIVIRRLTRGSDYAERMDSCSLRLYGYQAKRILKNSAANVYHYRSGYGHSSVALAKQKGMAVLCDHSIAHPETLEYLIQNHGNMPPRDYAAHMNSFWSNIMEDIDQADNVLVNSDFVKETFVNRGWAPERVHVVYTGIDNEFLDAVPERSKADSSLPLQFIFAGEFGPRKGAEVLIQALQQIKDAPWQLEIIGNIDPVIRHQYGAFLADHRVVISGFLPRLELAAHMSRADVFIFPSLAEGSARVIFMAMACGCYVITTHNSGSIVEDGIHGALVKAGDAVALEKAIRKTQNMSRQEIAQTGLKNAELVRNYYTQTQYGESLFKLYKRLFANIN